MNTQYVCMPGCDMSEVRDLAMPEDWFFEAVGAQHTDSGVSVNAYSALGNCSLWQGVNILAGDVGQLPIKLYRKSGRNREEISGVPAIELLRSRPNSWQLPSVWKETMMQRALLWGNALSWIRFRGDGKAELIPLRPESVGYELDDLTGDLFYTYNSHTTGARLTFEPSEIFHIQGLASDGLWGYSLVHVAKNCIGHALALEKHGNSTFRNSARPSVVLRHPGRMTPEGRQNLRHEWNEIHKGPDNSGRVAVLWEGMEIHPFSMSNEDAQWLEARKLDREFIASLLNLPAFKLNALENSSVRANLEEQNRDYFQTSLSRWLNRFAEEARAKLLTEAERVAEYYYRWVVEAFLKGDIQKRYGAYSVAIASRIMNPNEVRELEDLNPYDGGDEYGNPNIDVMPEEEDDESDAAASDLISDRIRQLVKIEIGTVKRASKAQNFVAWVDTYYSTGFREQAESVLTPTVDAVRILAPHVVFDATTWINEHAVESKRRLLKMCDQTLPERLAEAISAECELWSTRT